MADLFVNYRKIDTRMSAAFVHDFLIGRFGAGQVFIDHTSMRPGDLYPPALRTALERARVLIVLIGPNWLAEDPDRPERRLVDREDDWVRNEIRRALERRIEIIPVLVDGASLPSFGTLPADINDVLKRQYATIRHRTAGADLVKLADFVVAKLPSLVLPGLFDEELPLPQDPPPSELLRSSHQIVGFRRFDDRLDRLESWLAEDGELGVRLVTGPGGAGKTRLAVELIGYARTDRWQAGFVAGDAEPEVIERLMAIKARLLLVVDYVEGRAAQIEALAKALLARPAGQGAVRVLLLARADGSWRRLLARHQDVRVAGLFRDLIVERIVAIDAGPSRQSLFQEAVLQFRENLGAEVSVEPPADLDDDRYDRVLDVLAAALSAVLDALVPDPMPLRSDPVRRVLDHEEHHWRRSAPAYGLTQRTEVLGEVVAAATLVGADDRAAARRVLESVRRVAEGGSGTATDFLTWLDRLYPGRAALNPLRPDRLGEDLIGAVLELDHPELAAELAAVLDENQVIRALTVLSRAAARHHPVVRQAMADLLSVDAAQRIVLGMTVATQVDDATLVDVLAEVGVVDDLTPVIVDNLPDSTLSLAALAVVHTKALLRAESRRVPVDTWAVAELRQNLAVRLTAVGELDQALTVAAEAVEAYRTLGEPGELAGALSTLANAYRRLGFHHDGVEHAVEAVRLLDGLDADDEDVATDLLNALVSLADIRHAAGEIDVAAESITRAVAIARRLVASAADEPLRRSRLAALASALGTVSGIHDTRNEWPASFRAGEEVVSILRELDAVEPDAYRGDLIEALGNHAGTHAELGRWAEGAALGEEAVELARSLVARHGEVHTTRLADTLNNTAALLRRLGEHTRALAHLGQAVSLYRGLANRLPGVHLVNLAGALHNLGNCLEDAGRPQDAIDAYEESIEIYEKLRGPDDDDIDSDLAEVLTGLAHARAALGNDEAAHDLAVEAVELLDNAMRVDRVRTRRRLAHALYLAAATASDLGKYKLAARDARRAADLYPRVVRESGRDLAAEHAGVLHLLGRSLDEVGEHAKAWPVFADALRLQRSLVDEADGDEEREELAHILLNAGVCAGAIDNHADAVAYLEEAVALWRARGEDDPQVRFELAEALNNLADSYCDVGDWAGAAVAADEALLLAEANFHRNDPASRSLLVYVLATRGRAAGDDEKSAIGFLRRAWETAANDRGLKAVVRSTCEQMGVSLREVRKR